jgi:hypothetical protein
MTARGRDQVELVYYPGDQIGVPDGADVIDYGSRGLSYNGGHKKGFGWRTLRQAPRDVRILFLHRPYAFGFYSDACDTMIYFGRNAISIKDPRTIGRYTNGSSWHSSVFNWQDEE